MPVSPTPCAPRHGLAVAAVPSGMPWLCQAPLSLWVPAGGCWQQGCEWCQGGGTGGHIARETCWQWGQCRGWGEGGDGDPGAPTEPLSLLPQASAGTVATPCPCQAPAMSPAVSHAGCPGKQWEQAAHPTGEGRTGPRCPRLRTPARARAAPGGTGARSHGDTQVGQGHQQQQHGACFPPALGRCAHLSLCVPTRAPCVPSQPWRWLWDPRGTRCPPPVAQALTSRFQRASHSSRFLLLM